MTDTTRAIPGKNGFLFLDGDSNHVIKQIKGELLLDKRQLLYWANLIKSRVLLLRDIGIDYRFIIPPNKESVYHLFLPDYVPFSQTRPVTQLIGALNEYSFYVFYDSDYDNYKFCSDIYGSTLFPMGETHWNDGFAYEYIKAALLDTSFAPLQLENLETYPKQLRWFDLGSKLRIDYSESVTGLRPRRPRARMVYTNNMTNIGRLEIWETDQKDLPIAVVFRDSFFTNLLQLFSESFSRVVYLWHPWIDYEVINDYKPDIVINCMVERFLVTLPGDFSAPSYKSLEKK